MRKYLKVIPLAIALACAGTGIAQAASLDSILNGVQVDGKVRAYYFTRQFTPNNNADVNAFSLGGIVNLHTDQAADGWGFGVTGMTAQSLGLNSAIQPDTTLMGKQSQYSALGQLYLQYRSSMFVPVLVRAGDQELSTPWMSGSDSRVLPATYQAVLVQVNPIDHLSVYAIRETAWKSRTSDNFYQDNLYYPSTWGGDQSYGGQPYAVGATANRASGTLAIGADYKANGINARLWYYDFYGFAKTYYGEATYTYKTGTGYDPFIGIQGLKQSQSYANSLFGASAVAPNGVAGDVNSQVQGVKVGVNIPHGQLFVAYDKVNYDATAFGGGIVVSPFTANYATDPLWTTSMIRGLVELGAGNAWKVKGTYKLFDNQLRLMAAWARYNTHFKGNSTNTYGDITWFFNGALKGLSLRDRIEVCNGALANGGGHDKFVYNRVMAEYDF
ncbi:MAG TPA: OprD family outer membrane porin [Mariprofundaceae bacterium]|nr:OprD family outer membrane porin [Mariprofundaceae bacterium]